MGAVARWMPAMEQQTTPSKGCCTGMILEEDYLLVVARKTLAAMVMVVVAVVVTCFLWFLCVCVETSGETWSSMMLLLVISVQSDMPQ